VLCAGGLAVFARLQRAAASAPREPDAGEVA